MKKEFFSLCFLCLLSFGLANEVKSPLHTLRHLFSLSDMIRCSVAAVVSVSSGREDCGRCPPWREGTAAPFRCHRTPLWEEAGLLKCCVGIIISSHPFSSRSVHHLHPSRRHICFPQHHRRTVYPHIAVSALRLPCCSS